jgi:hypothetical protein
VLLSLVGVFQVKQILSPVLACISYRTSIDDAKISLVGLSAMLGIYSDNEKGIQQQLNKKELSRH